MSQDSVAGEFELTDAQRNAAILQRIEEYKSQNTASADVARRGLIRQGIYTKTGQLAPEYGGPARSKKPARDK